MSDAHAKTVLGSGTVIKGEMSFDEAVCIQGQFEGKIEAKGELDVAQGAICKAQIQAGNVTVAGTIEGVLHASQRVRLSATAKVNGEITAEALETADGASIGGNLDISGNTPRTSAPPPPPAPAQVIKPLIAQPVERT